MKYTCIYLFLIVILFSSCGPKLDGSSEKNFKASYEKIKAGLSETEQSKLDLAVVYVAGAAMADKWDGVKEYKDLSIDAIVMKKLAGKTKGGILDYGEECLKKEKQREITNAQESITDLNKDMKEKKAGYDSIKIKTDGLKGRFVKMVMENGLPAIYCEFKNVTKKDTFDYYGVEIDLSSIAQRKAITSFSGLYSGQKSLAPGDTVMQKLSVSQYDMGEGPDVAWAKMTYPVTDPAKYNLRVTPFTNQLKYDDKSYDLSSINWSSMDEADYQANLKELTDKLKAAQNKPDNLDDEMKAGGKPGPVKLQ